MILQLVVCCYLSATVTYQLSWLAMVVVMVIGVLNGLFFLCIACILLVSFRLYLSEEQVITHKVFWNVIACIGWGWQRVSDCNGQVLANHVCTLIIFYNPLQDNRIKPAYLLSLFSIWTQCFKMFFSPSAVYLFIELEFWTICNSLVVYDITSVASPCISRDCVCKVNLAVYDAGC